MTNADMLQRNGVRAEMHNWHTPTSKAGQKKSYEALVNVYDTDIRLTTGYVAYREVIDRVAPYLPIHAAAPSSTPVRVLDAGCGTGLSGWYLKTERPDLFTRVSLHGVDYCDAMLQRAAKTESYAALHVRDIDAPFDLPDNRKVDAVVAAGVFFENHVEPCAMSNIFAHLVLGGHAVVSVRQTSFEKRKGDYLEAVWDSGCVIVDIQTGPYREAENMNGTYLILKKMRD